MNRIITIVVSVILLNGTTEVHQLWQLPFLVKHYRYHQRAEPSLSFFLFLEAHYNGPEKKPDNDAGQDTRLPFKTTGSLYHTDIPELVKRDIPDFYCYPEAVQLFIPGTEGKPCHPAFAVFHPPRLNDKGAVYFLSAPVS